VSVSSRLSTDSLRSLDIVSITFTIVSPLLVAVVPRSLAVARWRSHESDHPQPRHTTCWMNRGAQAHNNTSRAQIVAGSCPVISLSSYSRCRLQSPWYASRGACTCALYQAHTSGPSAADGPPSLLRCSRSFFASPRGFGAHACCNWCGRYSASAATHEERQRRDL